ncbi:MAG: hypothetical protein IJG31_00275 [Fusobacterium sp.]|nr:hypothetical protein [Fusobacterium sp.]
MKELLAKLEWKACHINTVNHRFNNAKILEISDNFLLIETEEQVKVILNFQFIRNIMEAKEGFVSPVFVQHDIA